MPPRIKATGILIGRIKLEDEALDFRVSMAETERLSERIA